MCFDGLRLIKIRKKRGFSRQKLAKKVDLSYDTILAMETQKGYNPYVQNVCRLAQVFDITMDYFCDRDESDVSYQSKNQYRLVKLIFKYADDDLLMAKLLDIYERMDEVEARVRLDFIYKILFMPIEKLMALSRFLGIKRKNYEIEIKLKERKDK
jgi:transcriptional regulator with XRE-family HTH domain